MALFGGTAWRGTAVGGSVSVASAQGPREHQEDRYVIAFPCCDERRGTLLAVMDGHNGSQAAERCRLLIPELFVSSAHGHDVEQLDLLVRTLADRLEDEEAGTTLSLVWVLPEPDCLYWAVIGDSPLVVIDATASVHRGPDHNVRTNAHERERAQARGGYYDDGYIYNSAGTYGLQMARGLGDAAMGSVVESIPECGMIAEPTAVLVATDGLADPAHHSDHAIDEVVAELRAGATADALVAGAAGRGLGDNATAVVWRKYEFVRAD